MIPLIFLHGGGNDPVSKQVAYGNIVHAMHAHENGRFALILAGKTMSSMEKWCPLYIAEFVQAGALPSNIVTCFLLPDKPLTRVELEAIAPQGIFVCGGDTPLYQQGMCADPGVSAYLLENNVVYGGLSAGAMIASTRAIVSGSVIARGGMYRQIRVLDGDEDTGLLTVRGGLGLVPFTVDVHATQAGVLPRLIHAVDAGTVERGCAIDENTLITVEGNQIRVMGLGHVYHITRESGAVRVTIHHAGDVIEA